MCILVAHRVTCFLQGILVTYCWRQQRQAAVVHGSHDDDCGAVVVARVAGTVAWQRWSYEWPAASGWRQLASARMLMLIKCAFQLSQQSRPVPARVPTPRVKKLGLTVV